MLRGWRKKGDEKAQIIGTRDESETCRKSSSLKFTAKTCRGGSQDESGVFLTHVSSVRVQKCGGGGWGC